MRARDGRFGACERCARSPGSAPARPASAPPATVRGGTLSTAAGHAAVPILPAHAVLVRFLWRVRAGTVFVSPDAAEGPRTMPAAPEAPQPPRDGGTVARSSSPPSSHQSHRPTPPLVTPSLPGPTMSSRAVLYAYRGSCVVWCFGVLIFSQSCASLGVVSGSPGPRCRSRPGGPPPAPGRSRRTAGPPEAVR